MTLLDRAKHTVNVHLPLGTFAVCFDVLDVRTLGYSLTVAKLDRGAPQIRYVRPGHSTSLTGPSTKSRQVNAVVTEARRYVQQAGYILQETE